MKKLLVVPLLFFLGVIVTLLVSLHIAYGQDGYEATGESYPTFIQTAGYNARASCLYLNLTLYTKREVGSEEKATFYYFVTVFDSNEVELGSAGTYGNPLSVTGGPGSNVAEVNNLQVAQTQLTASYRVVIIVEQVKVDQTPI